MTISWIQEFLRLRTTFALILLLTTVLPHSAIAASNELHLGANQITLVGSETSFLFDVDAGHAYLFAMNNRVNYSYDLRIFQPNGEYACDTIFGYLLPCAWAFSQTSDYRPFKSEMAGKFRFAFQVRENLGSFQTSFTIYDLTKGVESNFSSNGDAKFVQGFAAGSFNANAGETTTLTMSLVGEDTTYEMQIFDSFGKTQCLFVSNVFIECENTFLTKKASYNFYANATGRYFVVINPFQEKNSQLNLKSSRPLSFDGAGISTPSAKPSPSSKQQSSSTPSTKPSSSSTFSKKAPAGVGLTYVGVNEISKDGVVKSSKIRGTTEYVQFYYYGDLNDLNSKPLGIRFYVKSQLSGVETLIGAGSLQTSKDVKAGVEPSCKLSKERTDKIQYICKIQFKPQANGIDAKSGILLSAATYNTSGESVRSNQIKLFPIMEKKAFLKCLEDGVSDTKKEIIASFVGIIVDQASSELVGKAGSTLNLGQNSWQEGVVKGGIEISGDLRDGKSVQDALSNAAMSNTLDQLNGALFGKNSVAIKGLTAGKASIAGIVVNGVLAGVDIYIAGQKGKVRITECETKYQP